MDLAAALAQSRPDIAVSSEYLDRLKGLPHSLLVNELEQLGTSLKAVSVAVADLGERHHTAFIGARSTLAELDGLVEELASSSQHAAEQARKVPGVSERAFVDTASISQQELQLYDNVDRIQDLLQIPELVRSCISSGYYGAALDLAGFASRLKGRYPTNAVVSDISNQVEDSIKYMVSLLVRLLRESSRLPTLIKTISFLRRVSPFRQSPTLNKDLQQLFLASRLNFIETQAKTLEVLRTSSPFNYLKKLVELWREHVFATLTGFKTIFNSDSDTLAEFTRECIAQLNERVAQVAPQITEKSDLASLWLQLAYCSRSLGRAGAEFWPFFENPSLSQDDWLEAFTNQQEFSKAAMSRASASG